VSPDFRRQRIAQKLIAGYEQEVWAKGYPVIYLSVYADNAAARALYEGCGWQAVNDGKIVTYQRRQPVSHPAGTAAAGINGGFVPLDLSDRRNGAPSPLLAKQQKQR
jgi:hypothetical protein